VNLQAARKLASYIAANMYEHCVPGSVRVLGSIRREKPEVKDIELIALPTWVEKDGGNLLGEPAPANLLHEWAMSEKTRRVIRWVKAGRGKLSEGNLEDTAPDPAGRYWRGVVTAPGAAPVMLDLFLPTPEGYGCQELIRTGSADFSHAVVKHAKRCGKSFDKGVLRVEMVGGESATLPCPREEDVFAALGLECIAPKDRIDASSLKRKIAS
jgi:DNA polymerase/3'-5' exonuclease PolX